MKNALLQWLSLVSEDARIPEYGFRVALRLASKVRDEKLITQLPKFSCIADTMAVQALVEAGFLSKADGPSRRALFFQIITAPAQVTA